MQGAVVSEEGIKKLVSMGFDRVKISFLIFSMVRKWLETF